MQAVIEQLGLMKDGVVQYKSILTAILEEVTRQADSKCKKEDADETGIQKNMILIWFNASQKLVS